MTDDLRDRLVTRALELTARDTMTSDDMDSAADELVTMAAGDRDALSSAMGLAMGRHASQGGPDLLSAFMVLQKACKR